MLKSVQHLRRGFASVPHTDLGRCTGELYTGIPPDGDSAVSSPHPPVPGHPTPLGFGGVLAILLLLAIPSWAEAQTPVGTDIDNQATTFTIATKASF